jgi:hypothetical protein
MKVIAALSSLLSLALGYHLAQEEAASKPTVYADGRYGFTIQAPAFGPAKKGTQLIPVMLLGPNADGFSPSTNVIVVEAPTTREQYREQSLTGFKAAGFTVTSEKNLTVSDRDAWLIHYTGKQGGKDLAFVALAVFGEQRTYLVTCTATKDGYAALEPQFLACLESFALTR